MSTGHMDIVVANKGNLPQAAEVSSKDKVLTAVKNLSALFPSKDKIIKSPAAWGQDQTSAITTCDGNKKGDSSSCGGSTDVNMFERARNLLKNVSLSKSDNNNCADKSSSNTVVLLDDDDSDADVVITSPLVALGKSTAPLSQRIVLSDSSLKAAKPKMTFESAKKLKTKSSSVSSQLQDSTNGAIIRLHNTSANSKRRHSEDQSNSAAAASKVHCAVGTVRSGIIAKEQDSVKVAVEPTKKRRSLRDISLTPTPSASEDVITIDDSCPSSLSGAEDSPRKKAIMPTLSPSKPTHGKAGAPNAGNNILRGSRTISKPGRRRHPALSKSGDSVEKGRVETALIDSVFSSLHRVDVDDNVKVPPTSEESRLQMKDDGQVLTIPPAQTCTALPRGDKEAVVRVSVFPKRPQLFDLALAPVALDTDAKDSPLGEPKPESKTLVESSQQKSRNGRSVWSDVSQAISEPDSGVGGGFRRVSGDCDHKGVPDKVARPSSSTGVAGATLDQDTLVKNFIDWSRQKLSGITVPTPGNNLTTYKSGDSIANNSLSDSTCQAGIKVDDLAMNTYSSTEISLKRPLDGDGLIDTNTTGSHSLPKSMRMAWVKPNNASICDDSESSLEKLDDKSSNRRVPITSSSEATLHDISRAASTPVGRLSQDGASAANSTTSVSATGRDECWWLDFVPSATSAVTAASSSSNMHRPTTKQPPVASVTATTKQSGQCLASSGELFKSSLSMTSCQNRTVNESDNSAHFLEKLPTEVRMLSNSRKEIQNEQTLCSHSDRNVLSSTGVASNPTEERHHNADVLNAKETTAGDNRNKGLTNSDVTSGTLDTHICDKDVSRKVNVAQDEVIMIDSAPESVDSSDSDTDSSDSDSSSSSSSSDEEAADSDIELVMVESPRDSTLQQVSSVTDSAAIDIPNVITETNTLTSSEARVGINDSVGLNDKVVTSVSELTNKTVILNEMSVDCGLSQSAEIANQKTSSQLEIGDVTMGKSIVEVASKTSPVDDSAVLAMSKQPASGNGNASSLGSTPSIPPLGSKGSNEEFVDKSTKATASRSVTPEALCAFTPTLVLNKSYLTSLMDELAERKESLSEDAYWEPKLSRSPSLPHFASEATVSLASVPAANSLLRTSSSSESCSSAVPDEWQRGFVAHKVNACRMPRSLIKIPQSVATTNRFQNKAPPPAVDDAGQLPILELRSSTLRRNTVLKSRMMTKARTVASEVGRQKMAYAQVTSQSLHSTQTTFNKSPVDVVATTSVVGVKKMPKSFARKMLATTQLPPPPTINVNSSESDVPLEGLADDTYTIQNVSESAQRDDRPSLKIKISRTRSSTTSVDGCSPVPASGSSTPSEPSTLVKSLSASRIFAAKNDDSVFSISTPKKLEKPSDIVASKFQEIANIVDDKIDSSDDFIVDFVTSKSSTKSELAPSPTELSHTKTGTKCKVSSTKVTNQIQSGNTSMKSGSSELLMISKKKMSNKAVSNVMQQDDAASNQKKSANSPANQKQSNNNKQAQKQRTKAKATDRLLRQLQSSEGFIMDKIKESSTGSFTSYSAREQRKLQQTLMQFSMQEVENQMRREKQSKAKAEDVDTVKPDISNLEPCSTSRSANAMSLANDSRRNDFKKCSVASSVKQSGRSAATHKASFARRRHRRNLQLDLAVTLAPGVKRLRTKAFHKDVVYEQALAEEQIKMRFKRRSLYGRTNLNVHRLQQRKRHILDYDNGDLYVSSPASTASSSATTAAAAPAPYSFWKWDRRKGGGGFKPKGPIRSIEARRRATNYTDTDQRCVGLNAVNQGPAPSVEIDIDEPALPSAAISYSGSESSVYVPNAALAKVGNLDIVKLEFVAQQLQHTVDKLSYRLPFSPNDRRKVKVGHVQPKKERIGSDADVLGSIHEHHSSTSSRRSVFESAAWSKHMDSVINSVACGNASSIQCEEVSTGTGDTTALKIEKAEEVLKGTALKMKGRKSNNGAKLILNRQTGETALHKAARLGREDMVQRLCQAGSIGVNAVDFAGYTALHESAAANRVRVAKLLIAHGANINAASFNDGIRPLHDAIEHDHLEMVRLLLSAGADWTVTTFSGSSVLELAKSLSMKNLLRDYSTDINGTDDVNKEAEWQLNRYSAKDLIQLPEECEGLEEEEFAFELFSQEPVPVYKLSTDSNTRSGNYMLLLDVLDRLGLSANEFVDVWDGDIESVPWSDLEQQVGWSLANTSRAQGGFVDVVPYTDLLATLTGLEDTVRVPALLPCDNTRHRSQINSDLLALKPLKRKKMVKTTIRIPRVVVKKALSGNVKVNTGSNSQQISNGPIAAAPRACQSLSGTTFAAPVASSNATHLSGGDGTVGNLVPMSPSRALVAAAVNAKVKPTVSNLLIARRRLEMEMNRTYSSSAGNNARQSNTLSSVTSAVRWNSPGSKHLLPARTSFDVATRPAGLEVEGRSLRPTAAMPVFTTPASQSDIVGGIISAMNQGQSVKVASGSRLVATSHTGSAPPVLPPKFNTIRAVSSHGQCAQPVRFIASSTAVSTALKMATGAALSPTSISPVSSRTMPSLSPKLGVISNLPIRVPLRFPAGVTSIRLATPPGANSGGAAMNLTPREQRLLTNAISSSASSAVRIRVVYDAAGIDIAPASSDIVISNSVNPQHVATSTNTQPVGSNSNLLP